MFERPHHQRIARVLESLDGALLREHGCWFGGGTAIALRCGEFRESVNIDFLVSDPAGYRALRQHLRGARDLSALSLSTHTSISLEGEALIDQYGIRAFAVVAGVSIKLEIVNEGRIRFDAPSRNDVVCGIATLSMGDLASSKFLTNSDRWANDSVFARDAIDLAMLNLPPRQLSPALDKAIDAYGTTVVEDMRTTLRRLRDRAGWLQRCMAALSIHLPPAVVQQKLRHLARRIDRIKGDTA